jgi:hypothetical protein
MEVKTEFIDTYTKTVDKSLIQCQTHKTIVYVLIALISLLTSGVIVLFNLIFILY